MSTSHMRQRKYLPDSHLVQLPVVHAHPDRAIQLFDNDHRTAVWTLTWPYAPSLQEGINLLLHHHLRSRALAVGCDGYKFDVRLQPYMVHVVYAMIWRCLLRQFGGTNVRIGAPHQQIPHPLLQAATTNACQPHRATPTLQHANPADIQKVNQHARCFQPQHSTPQPQPLLWFVP